MDVRTYRVTVDAWINGGFRAAGGTIPMLPAEAKYWLLAGTLEEITVPLPPVVEKPSRKGRE